MDLVGGDGLQPDTASDPGREGGRHREGVDSTRGDPDDGEPVESEVVSDRRYVAGAVGHAASGRRVGEAVTGTVIGEHAQPGLGIGVPDVP